MTIYLICSLSKTKGATSGAGTAYRSGAPEFPLVVREVRITRSLVLREMFCRSLFVLLSFFYWPLCCLSFFDLRSMISPFTLLPFCGRKTKYIYNSNPKYSVQICSVTFAIGRLFRYDVHVSTEDHNIAYLTRITCLYWFTPNTCKHQVLHVS
jgi:hypothetical protein